MPTFFRTVAISGETATAVVVARLGISLRGGPVLEVSDEHGFWPSTPEALIAARAQAAQLRALGVEPEL